MATKWTVPVDVQLIVPDDIAELCVNILNLYFESHPDKELDVNCIECENGLAKVKFEITDVEID